MVANFFTTWQNSSYYYIWFVTRPLSSTVDSPKFLWILGRLSHNRKAKYTETPSAEWIVYIFLRSVFFSLFSLLFITIAQRRSFAAVPEFRLFKISLRFLYRMILATQQLPHDCLYIDDKTLNSMLISQISNTNASTL